MSVLITRLNNKMLIDIIGALNRTANLHLFLEVDAWAEIIRTPLLHIDLRVKDALQIAVEE